MTTHLSMRARGRLAGAAYLGIFVAGLIYMNFIPDTGLLTTEWGHVVDHILANQTAFWIGFPFFLLSIVFRIVFLQLAYGLFRGVNDGVNRLGVFVYLVGASLQVVMAVCLMAPVVLFNSTESRAAFTQEQLHALATSGLQFYILTYNVALAFFGLYSLLLGYLMVRSSLVPRVVGACIMISGLGWLTFFVPPVAAALLPNNLIIGLSGEAVIILWLLARGVNASQSGSVIATTTGSIPPSSAIFGPWDDLLMLMKAVVCTGYGPPDVLQMGEVARPLPRKREVCIRIFTTAVTASDCIIRDGFRLNFPYRVVGRLAIGVTAPRQPILGMVLAGAIESVGSGVTRFRPGDRVFGMGGFHFGCYAEFVCWPEDAVLAVLPSNLKYEEAAAIPYGGLTARALSDARRRPSRPPNADLRRLGSDWHIGGAVSPPYRGRDHRRVQLFETELVRCHGATAVIDYTRENFADREERYDVIFDAVGKRKSRDAMLHSANALAPNGKRISVDDGMPRLRRAALLELRQVCESGVLRPVIDGCYRLEEIVEAHRYVDQGHKRGNVVVTVS